MHLWYVDSFGSHCLQGRDYHCALRMMAQGWSRAKSTIVSGRKARHRPGSVCRRGNVRTVACSEGTFSTGLGVGCGLGVDFVQ